jgi:peptidoglycan DL-endopeptidase CwlO
MRELAVLLLVAPIALMIVLTNELHSFGQSSTQGSTITIGRIAEAPTPTLASTTSASTSGGLIARVIDQARTWLGVPYLWGGCSTKGVDCSCFVQNVLKTVGIVAPRTTVDQVRWGSPVSRADLRAGDLVFFDSTCVNCGANPTHVGMYLGQGLMIDAGNPVQINAVFSGFYGSHFAEARRPPGL